MDLPVRRPFIVKHSILTWILTNGQPLGKQLGFSELPHLLLNRLRLKLNSIQLF